MAKAFLSHSSKDKLRYVELVFKALGSNKCIYDSVSFEEGMKNYDEIISGLDNTDLFVLFISNDSLNSPWVKREILESHDRLKNGGIKRIFPIIIDSSITHRDKRIPEWMRDEYNLQFISRPKLSARRILQRLIEISWDYHPLIKDRQNLFVGRNKEISSLEMRFDSFDLEAPNCLFVCGLDKIGRRSFSKRALVKCNIIKESYSFSSITLSIDESIEDFILKIYDLGFSETKDIDNLLFKPLEEKIELANKLLEDCRQAREILQIIDNGCLISPDGNLSTWFSKIMERIDENDKNLYFNIISKFRFFKPHLLPQNIHAINLRELDDSERTGLLKRYADLSEIELDLEIIETFKNTLSGFPEQTYYCIDLIKSHGVDYVKENSHMIVEYNTEKVKSIIKEYEANIDSKNMLLLLSEFDFISIEFLNEFLQIEKNYIQIVKNFIVSGICEHIGASKEYIRLNDGIKDYINRLRIDLPKSFKDIIKQHSENFARNINDYDGDLSEVMFDIKYSLKTGKEVPSKFQIPSHFLKTINNLYDTGKKYSLIIELADRILRQSSYIDHHIQNEIRYKLCLSLARTANKDRFFREIKSLDKEDMYYLLGFYYRLTGNLELSLSNIYKFLALKPRALKGKRELVQILIDVEEYEDAFVHAKEIYDSENLNPYNILAYAKCLFKVKPNSYKETIESLIRDLELIDTDISNEMAMGIKAECASVFDNNKEIALSIIDACIETYPDNPFPLLTKLNICEKFRLPNEMQSALDILKSRRNKHDHFNNTITIIEVKCLAMSGKVIEARQLIDKKLEGKLPINVIQRLKEKINLY